MLYSEYREPLEDAAAKWFAEHTKAAVNPKAKYILADHTEWPHNLIDDRILPLVEGVRPRHTYIHHGLSSQALCFNLFGSLLCTGNLAALREIVLSKGGTWPEGPCEGQFEFDDIAVFTENHREQPTSWDFAINLPGKYPFALVEVKFVEQSVGACSVFARGDCNGGNPAKDFNRCFLQKEKGRTYWQVFQDCDLLQTPPFAGTICPMTIYYQFYREATFAAKKNVQVFYIYDDRNPIFGTADDPDQRGLIPLLLHDLPPRVRNNILLIPLREIVRSLHNSGDHKTWLPSFASKYDFAENIV